MEAIGDLIWADPTGLRHRWIDALAPQDPQSLLQPLLRAANRAWALHRDSLQLPGIVLQIGEPDPAVLTDVAKTAIALDLPLELDEEGSPSAQELLAGFADSDHRRVLEQQLSHALSQPVFAVACQTPVTAEADDSTSSTDGDEKATAPLVAEVPWCCASLSYAHLANQQVLVSLLQDGKDRPTVRHKTRLALGERGCAETLSWPLFTASQEEKLQGVCTERFVQRLNSRRRQIHELERDLVTMVQARSAEPLVDSETEGRISGVQSYGFFVEVGPTRVEGLVHVSSLNDDWYEYRSRQNRLVGRKTRRVYQLGDSVRVRVIKVDVLRNQIDLDVIADPVPATEEEDKIFTPIPVTLSNA
jgi:ribonuclease R